LPFPDFDSEVAAHGAGPRQESSGPRAFQFLDRYILVEEHNGEAVEVIDQHALHERVIFDRLRAQLAGARLESQRLLFPVPVELTPSQAEAFGENQAAFNAIGFEVALDDSGDRPAIAVTAVPRVAIQKDIPEFLRAILDDWDQGEAVLGRDANAEGTQGSWGGPLGAVRDDVLALIACKAACKAGDPLAPEEVAGLLRSRAALTNRHNCPHGRPTSLRITNSEFERWFLRK
jgi:DNA mismatch repair protein MutL